MVRCLETMRRVLDDNEQAQGRSRARPCTADVLTTDSLNRAALTRTVPLDPAGAGTTQMTLFGWTFPNLDLADLLHPPRVAYRTAS